MTDEDMSKINTHFFDDDAPVGERSVPGTRKTAVRKLLGEPEDTFVKRGVGSSRFPCDVYSKRHPSAPPESQYIALCYDKSKRLAVIIDPYTPG